MYTGMVMFLFCTLAENPEFDFLLIIHLNPSLILFHWSCGKYTPGLLVSLEVTDVFLETTSTVFHFENPNAARFAWWGWEEELSTLVRRLRTAGWTLRRGGTVQGAGDRTVSVGPRRHTQCTQGCQEALVAPELGIPFRKLVNVSWVLRG